MTGIAANTKKVNLDEARFHKKREAAIVLHRLRSGLNGLNQTTHKFDPSIEETCRMGCPAIENASHVILDSLHHEDRRLKLKTFTERNNIPWRLQVACRTS